MNKDLLVKTVAATTGKTQKEVKEVVNATLEAITNALVEGNEVKLAGFGKFEVVERAERTGTNPSTGESIIIPATNSVKFKASSTLKEAVR